MTRPVRPSDSSVECTYLVMPPDTNVLGNCFGGCILGWMDVAAGIAAWRHCKNPAVTVAIDNIHFAEAIHLGDVVVVKAQVDFTGKTSMEIGISVDVDDVRNRVRKHCLDGFFTFVALDDSGKPTEVTPVVPETLEEKARYWAAELRRKQRKGLK